MISESFKKKNVIKIIVNSPILKLPKLETILFSSSVIYPKSNWLKSLELINELIILDSFVKYKSLYFSIMLFTEFWSSDEFKRDKFLACSTKRGIKDLIIRKMIDTSPVIDVIAAKVLLNLSFVFKNKIVGFNITATTREIEM